MHKEVKGEFVVGRARAKAAHVMKQLLVCWMVPAYKKPLAAYGTYGFGVGVVGVWVRVWTVTRCL